MSELRDGQLPADTYHYAPNGAGTGNTARLTQIDLTVGGTRDFTFGPAGHLEEVHAGANLVDFDSDDEGRMASLTRFSDNVTFTYDGRSFLASATEVGGDFVTPTYSSQGLLYSLFRSQDGGLTTSTRHVFYFASRPVATMETDGAALVYTFLSTDHLGTPWVATALNGQELWSGGFEPFGRDWQKGTSQDAQENGIFLRFPGQWVDGTWEGASLGAEVFYNVHRWYEVATARYGKVDPIEASPNVYGYVDSRPTRLVDPFGLLSLDPDSCSPFKDGAGGAGGGLRCCYDDLEKAVQQYNEFFTPGWRQRNPDCWNAIANAPSRSGWRRPLGRQHVISPLSCMVTGHYGETMKCEFKFRRGGIGRGGCGFTNDTGQTFFRPKICDRGTCPSPLNILFHERLHRCGAPPETGGLFSDAADIARTCVGP